MNLKLLLLALPVWWCGCCDAMRSTVEQNLSLAVIGETPPTAHRFDPTLVCQFTVHARTQFFFTATLRTEVIVLLFLLTPTSTKLWLAHATPLLVALD